MPPLIATSVVRGAEPHDCQGGVYLVDFGARSIRQMVDWDRSEIDWRGRGGDRGLRGIAFHGDEIYFAASDELFVYDRDFRIQRSFRSSYLDDCQGIFRYEKHLYLASMGRDSILAFDLDEQAFIWAMHLAVTADGAVGTAFNPRGFKGPGGAKGPSAENRLHLNSVHANRHGLFASGLSSGGLLHVGNNNRVRLSVEMPEGIHDARPFRDGVLFNDTNANVVRYTARDGSERVMKAPGDFARGLCAINDDLIVAGSSPSTLALFDLESGTEIGRVNFSSDSRSAIHGIEIWPY